MIARLGPRFVELVGDHDDRRRRRDRRGVEWIDREQSAVTGL
ncbi:MAG: hypothetical protein VX672_00025 [Planctomycetota bacterium]|nr:hypothetical protein [Planctomycetota bacterium]